MAGYCELRGQNDSAWADFDVGVMIMDYEESVDVLDGEAAGRSKLRGSMIRDPLGAFLGHKFVFQRGASVEEFDALWNWLKDHCVEDYVYLRAADGQTTIDQKVYYTHFSRKLEFAYAGTRFWNNITVNFVPMDPVVIPS